MLGESMMLQLVWKALKQQVLNEAMQNKKLALHGLIYTTAKKQKKNKKNWPQSSYPSIIPKPSLTAIFTHFCRLQVVKNWSLGRPKNRAELPGCRLAEEATNGHLCRGELATRRQPGPNLILVTNILHVQP